MEKNTDPRYKIISQNKMFLLPTYSIFFQHIIGNILFFLALLKRVHGNSSLKCTTVSVRQLYFVRTALANAGTLYSDLLLPRTIYLVFHIFSKQTQSDCFTSLLG